MRIKEFEKDRGLVVLGSPVKIKSLHVKEYTVVDI